MNSLQSFGDEMIRYLTKQLSKQSISHKLRFQKDSAIMKWDVTTKRDPIFKIRLEMQGPATKDAQDAQHTLVLPCILSDLIGDYIGFHQCFFVQHVADDVLAFSPDLKVHFDPLHQHWGVESPEALRDFLRT